MLQVKAQCYSIEAANPRHEHEWRVWEKTRLPPGRTLVPGVISHATSVVEHPELVAERIERVARLLGRENVMAGSDCGFAQVTTRDRNAWYAEISAREAAAIAGPLRERIIAVSDVETYERWRDARQALAAATSNGSLRPTHLRGKKPLAA